MPCAPRRPPAGRKAPPPERAARRRHTQALIRRLKNRFPAAPGAAFRYQICSIFIFKVDQLLSAMFPGDQDEDEQEEAYQQRAEGVEHAGRQLAALHKKRKSD